MEQLQAFEQASLCIANPTGGNKEAEKFISQIQKSKRPYAFCQTILSQSKEEKAHFQALLVIREAVIREWTEICCDNTVNTLQDFLLSFGTQTQANYVTIQGSSFFFKNNFSTEILNLLLALFVSQQEKV